MWIYHVFGFGQESVCEREKDCANHRLYSHINNGCWGYCSFSLWRPSHHFTHLSITIAVDWITNWNSAWVYLVGVSVYFPLKLPSWRNQIEWRQKQQQPHHQHIRYTSIYTSNKRKMNIWTTTNHKHTHSRTKIAKNNSETCSTDCLFAHMNMIAATAAVAIAVL